VELAKRPKKYVRPFVHLPAYAYLIITLLATYSMVGKVGARFLEIPLLYVATLLTLLFTRLPRKHQFTVASLWILLGTCELWQNYIKPSLEERQIGTTFRLGRFMKDCSDDFLPKTKWVKKLSEDGCKLTDLAPESQSIELKFMSYGDWPTPKQRSCRLGH